MFETVEIDDEIVCVPIGEGTEKLHGVLKLNKTGYDIIKELENEITIEEIVSRLSSKYDTDCHIISKYVSQTIEQLRSFGIID